MSESDFTALLLGVREARLYGVLILLGEWLGGLLFLSLPFRWGIPYVQRTVTAGAYGLPQKRTETGRLVLVPGQDGEWLFRPPFHLFKLSTPFPLHGRVVRDIDRLHAVGRHPVGGIVFFGAVVLDQVLVGLAPFVSPAIAAYGTPVDYGAFVYAVFIVGVFYIAPLLVERGRFLAAVEDIRALAEHRQ